MRITIGKMSDDNSNFQHTLQQSPGEWANMVSHCFFEGNKNTQVQVQCTQYGFQITENNEKWREKKNYSTRPVQNVEQLQQNSPR